MSSSPGPDLISRAAQLRRPALTAAALGAGALALVARDPHRHTWVLCPFKALTGWDCPACGGLRAVNDLGTGRLADAAHSNLLLVGSLPLLAIAWLLWTGRAWTGRPTQVAPSTTRWVLAAYAVVAVAFTIIRNTPWGSSFHVS